MLDLQDPEQYDLHARLKESETPEALLLTDDHNPLELFDLANREAVRRGILESTDWSLLLG